jgi:hypothetical protein
VLLRRPWPFCGAGPCISSTSSSSVFSGVGVLRRGACSTWWGAQQQLPPVGSVPCFSSPAASMPGVVFGVALDPTIRLRPSRTGSHPLLPHILLPTLMVCLPWKPCKSPQSSWCWGFGVGGVEQRGRSGWVA